MSAREAIWLMAKEITEFGGDRSQIEATLIGLESKGIVDRTREPSTDPETDDPMEPADWWGLTDLGWELLGESKPARYH